MKTSYKRGFTLIELLVVIAIIGILSSIVLASLNSARKKGRDARRISDIKQTQLALELYYDAHSSYPTAALYATNLVSEGFISTLPTDPSAGASYGYAPGPASCTTACTTYTLKATLETAGHTALANDVDGTSNGLACGTQGASEVEYCVTP